MGSGRAKVVILGGGFGGLTAAHKLKRAPVDVTLIDRRNHHLFQPLLYQVATAALNPSDIAMPIRSALRAQANCEVILGEVAAIDLAGKQVRLTDGAVPFDYLIIATGATHSYFGHEEWGAFAPGLKTLEDAVDIRRRTLLAYEEAEREDDPARRRALLTFAVIGGGPTGVEMAGALAEIARHVLTRDFRHIDPSSARVVLIEAGPRVLPAYVPELSEKARLRLQKMGVEVLLDTRVVGVDAEGVDLDAKGTKSRIDSRTLVWGAGVEASPIAKSLGVPLDQAGRVAVEPDLSVPGATNVFVVGDLAAVRDKKGAWVPGVAPAAQQEGRHAVKMILADLEKKPRAPFQYLDKGSLAAIGRAAAVAQVGNLHTEGFFAWCLWLVVHIATLIGFRNRLLVLAQWGFAYLRFERGARLITGGIPPLKTSAKMVAVPKIGTPTISLAPTT